MCASFPTLKSVYNHIFALNAIGHASSTHQHNQLVQFIFYSFGVQEKNRSACIYNVVCATAMASIICFSIIFIFSNNHVHRLKVKKKMRPARTHTHSVDAFVYSSAKTATNRHWTQYGQEENFLRRSKQTNAMQSDVGQCGGHGRYASRTSHKYINSCDRFLACANR